ncbi:hypothetical protein EIP86_005865 [Pleurotus ostreatoroseus]|nr:hypothetical protein EIP86_005865 [Pleurotus ostreatoroseus]
MDHAAHVSEEHAPSQPRKTAHSHVQDKQHSTPSSVRKHSEDLTYPSDLFMVSNTKGSNASPHARGSRQDDVTYIYETPIYKPSYAEHDTMQGRKQQTNSGASPQSSPNHGHCNDPLCRMQKDLFTTLMMNLYGARAHCNCHRHLPDHPTGHRHRHTHSDTSSDSSGSSSSSDSDIPRERFQKLMKKAHEFDSSNTPDSEKTLRDDATPRRERLVPANDSSPLPPTTSRRSKKPRIYLSSEDRHVGFRSDPSIIPGPSVQPEAGPSSSTSAKGKGLAVTASQSPILGNVDLPPEIPPLFTAENTKNDTSNLPNTRTNTDVRPELNAKPNAVARNVLTSSPTPVPETATHPTHSHTHPTQTPEAIAKDEVPVLALIQDNLVAQRIEPDVFQLDFGPNNKPGGGQDHPGDGQANGIWPAPNQGAEHDATHGAHCQHNHEHHEHQHAPAAHAQPQAEVPIKAPPQILGIVDTTLRHKDVTYRILGALGAGTYGNVYCAVESRKKVEGQTGSSAVGLNTTKERPVAIKVMHKDTMYKAHHGRSMTLNEIDIMHLVKQDGRKWLVGLDRAWSSDYDIFLVMDLYASHLQSWIAQSSPTWFPFRIYAAEMILMLCDLRDAGIVHGDIKPDNILVGNDGHLALSDFGAAHLIRNPIDGVPLTTPDYSPPEAVKHLPGLLPSLDTEQQHGPKIIVDTYDVWSMALCLLQMYARTELSAAEEVEHNNMLEFQEHIAQLNCEELSIMRYLENHNPLLWDLVRKMMANDPLKRWYADALKKHPYFDGINWGELNAKKRLPHCPPPPTPDVKNKNPHFRPECDRMGNLCLHPLVVRGILDDAKRGKDVFERCADSPATVQPT